MAERSYRSYDASEAGKVRRARYNASATRRACRARYNARQRAIRDNRTKKLGKLLNLSVNGATEHERRLARQKYNQLKERRSVA